VECGYEESHVIGNKEDKIEFTFDVKAMHAILSELIESKFIKVMHCKTTKEIWDKLKTINEGNEKVKRDKLQGYII